MKKISTLWILIFLALTTLVNAQEKGISFTENKGQWNSEALYRAELPGGLVFLSKNGPVYHFYDTEKLESIHDSLATTTFNNSKDERIKLHAYRFRFMNANQTSTTQAEGKLETYENYFLGNDSSKWASDVRLYKKVKQNNVFDNIDVAYYSKDNNLKYDFIVKPGASIASIKLALEGAEAMLNEKKQLVITTSVNTLIEDAPFTYQVINEDTLVITSEYSFENNILGFNIGDYNHNFPLIIDPGLIFSTYSGANISSFWSFTATHDYAGNTIIGALAFGIGWPTQLGSYDTSFNGVLDAAILKMTPDGSNRIFATYLGGSGSENPCSITCSESNSIFIMGHTDSQDFPVFGTAAQALYGGLGDNYVTKLRSNGTALMGSTFLGGSGNDGLAIYSPITYENTSPSRIKFNETDHSLWLTSTSQSTNFPTTANALQASSTFNGPLIAQLDSNLNQILYSSFINSNDSLFIHDLKVSKTNMIYLCGNTKATNMGTPGAFNSSYLGGTLDGFVMKLNAASKTVAAFTYIGTVGQDAALKLTLNPSSTSVYVSGQTTGTYPVSANSYGSGVNSRNFIQLLDSALASGTKACTFGGQTPFATSDIYTGACAALGIGGMQHTTTFPTTSTAYANNGEFWFGIFSLNLETLLYGTYYGYGGHTHNGTFTFDTLGNLHHSVCDIGGSFVASPNAWSPTKLTTGYDMVTFKFDISQSDKLLEFELSNNQSDTGCAPYLVNFQNNSFNFVTYDWNFGDGTISTLFQPSKLFNNPGHYKVILSGTNPICNYFEQDSVTIVVKEKRQINPFASDTTVCGNAQPFVLTIDSVFPANLLSGYQVVWEPANAFTPGGDQLHVIAHHQLTNVAHINFIGLQNDSLCLSDTSISINLNHFDSSQIALTPPTAAICFDDSLLLQASGGNTYTWNSPNTNFLLRDDSSGYYKGLISGVIKVRIKDEHQCVYDRESNITIWQLDPIDAGEAVVLRRGTQGHLKGTSASSIFYWRKNGVNVFGNELDPMVSWKDTGTYYLYNVSTHGCINYDTVNVYMNEIKTPNAFSPNGDGVNDVFNPISFNDHAEIIDFSVYNRWGDRIFYTNKLHGAWDGYFNQKPCDVGVYFYVVEYKIGEVKYKDRGEVTLIK